MKKIEFKEVFVTPKVAQEYLDANIRNRDRIDNRIETYSKDMKEGRWKRNTAEFIKISKTGVLLDGQNRLFAIIDSNTSMYMWVSFNLEDDVFDVLDTGKARSAADVLKISGIKYNTALPGIIYLYNVLKTGSIGLSKIRLTNAEIRNIYYKNEDWWLHIARSSNSMYDCMKKLLTMKTIGGFYAIFHEIDKDIADNFMSELTTGKNVTNNVIILLRDKLLQDKLSSKKTKDSIKLIYIIKSWNFYYNNIEPKTLKFNPEQDNIPKIQGLITNKVNNKLGLIYNDNQL